MTQNPRSNIAGKSIAQQNGRGTQFRTQNNNPPCMNSIFKTLDKRCRTGIPLLKQELRGIIQAADASYGLGGQLAFINFCLNYGALKQLPDRSFVFDPVKAMDVRNACRKGQALCYVVGVKHVDEDSEVPEEPKTEEPPVSEPVAPEIVAPIVTPPVRKTRLAYLKRMDNDALDAISICITDGTFVDGGFVVPRDNDAFLTSHLGELYAHSVEEFFHATTLLASVGILAEAEMNDPQFRVFRIVGDPAVVKVVAMEKVTTVRVPQLVVEMVAKFRADPSVVPPVITDVNAWGERLAFKAFFGRLRKTGGSMELARQYAEKLCTWKPENPSLGWGLVDMGDDGTVLHCIPGLEAVTLVPETVQAVVEETIVAETVMTEVVPPAEDAVFNAESTDECIANLLADAKALVAKLEAEVERRAEAKARAEAEAREAEAKRIREEKVAKLKAEMAVMAEAKAVMQAELERMAAEEARLKAELDAV